MKWIDFKDFNLSRDVIVCWLDVSHCMCSFVYCYIGTTLRNDSLHYYLVTCTIVHSTALQVFSLSARGEEFVLNMVCGVCKKDVYTNAI